MSLSGISATGLIRERHPITAGAGWRLALRLGLQMRAGAKLYGGKGAASGRRGRRS